MVGGDRVAEQADATGAADVLVLRQVHRHAVEVGRVLDVGRLPVPRVLVALGHFHRVPFLAALEHLAVVLGEHGRVDGLRHQVGDLLVAGPDVLEVNVLAVLTLAERLFRQVDVDGARDRERHHQRRRGEVVHLHFGVDAALEVAVAGQHRRHREVVVVDAPADVLGQRAGVADTSGAAVADQEEAELLQVFHQAGGFEVIGDDLRARRQRGLDPGLGREAALGGLARQETRADHHRGVGGVGARRDRGDHHRTVFQFAMFVIGTDVRRGFGLAFRGAHRGTAALIQEAFLLPVPLFLAILAQRVHRGLVAFAHVGEQHAVLRTLGAGQRRLDVGEVQFDHRTEFGLRRVLVVPQTLCLRIGFDQLDLVRVTSRQAQVVERFLVDRADRAGRAVFRRHVAERGAVGQRQVLQTGAEELHELADHAVLAQHLGHGQHKVGRGRAFRQFAGETEADHLRDQHRRRLAQHRGFGLDAADTPAQHAEAVDHRGVGVGAEQGVRERPCLAIDVARHHHAREVFEVHLVHDAGGGRHHLEIIQRLLAPAQEGVTFVVALEFDLGIARQRVGLAEHIHLHRVVDHEFRGRERVDLLGVAAQRHHRIAHRGEIDHARHAGEILQHHACGQEGNLGGRLGLRIPVQHRFDLRFRDFAAVLVAQQVFQQDLHRVGQALEVVLLAQFLEARDLVRPAADGEGVANPE